MGEVPDWYLLMLAADRLNCTPWDLAERPVFWREAALAARKAEASDHRRVSNGADGIGHSGGNARGPRHYR